MRYAVTLTELMTKMTQLDLHYEMIAARQRDLRALARPQPLIVLTEPVADVARRVLGRSVMRLRTVLTGDRVVVPTSSKQVTA